MGKIKKDASSVRRLLCTDKFSQTLEFAHPHLNQSLWTQIEYISIHLCKVPPPCEMSMFDVSVLAKLSYNWCEYRSKIYSRDKRRNGSSLSDGLLEARNCVCLFDVFVFLLSCVLTTAMSITSIRDERSETFPFGGMIIPECGSHTAFAAAIHFGGSDHQMSLNYNWIGLREKFCLE